ncbi:hypothetical protein [Spirosoma sp. KNUC1025]|uniref:hypothetical protein n=1 Tax=Spirosoma sp. KNUC1025 TaxID=2894082 RepID=UPI00386C5E5E|nr:hypothetical protein LN737_17970 [Spirosoma sp. KNUC1025]
MPFYKYVLPLILIYMQACQKPTDSIIPEPIPPAPSTGTPTAIGQPSGSPTTKTIGPAGGTISTPDGTMTLTFPAGALSKELPITIQPIENKAFQGAGSAYRFSPDGTQFAKPVTMTWHYQRQDIDGSSPDALSIAFQDQQGIWQGSTKVNVNKSTQTVSAQLPHFSDWAFYKQFFLRYSTSDSDSDPINLATGDHIKLTVYYFENTTDTSLLAPLIPAKVMLAERVVRWTINGITDNDNYDDYGNNGQLTQDNTYAQATYDAPPREPDNNPMAVAVEIDLKQKGHLILIRNIKIESVASLNIDGSVDNNPTIGLTLNGSQLMGIINNRNATQILSFTINNFKGKGTYTINENHTVLITARVPERIPYADSYYDLAGKWISGGSSITITEYNGNDKLIRGTVSGNLFWIKPEGNVVVIENMPISAKFRTLPVVIP